MSNGNRAKIRSHRQLWVYLKAMEASMLVFEVSKNFPREELFSLTDQIRRSSRSVCANLAEAWRKRRYKAAFISKLSDSEAEAAESQVWLEYAVKCGYVPREQALPIYFLLDETVRMLVSMIKRPENWVTDP